MSLIQKFRNRINATQFVFSIHVHTLQPWPAGNKAIAIGWQRGKRRRGATSSVLPLPSKDKLGTVVRFNEKFMLSSSLYRVRAASHPATHHAKLLGSWQSASCTCRCQEQTVTPRWDHSRRKHSFWQSWKQTGAHMPQQHWAGWSLICLSLHLLTVRS